MTAAQQRMDMRLQRRNCCLDGHGTVAKDYAETTAPASRRDDGSGRTEGA